MNFFVFIYEGISDLFLFDSILLSGIRKNIGLLETKPKWIPKSFLENFRVFQNLKYQKVFFVLQN